MNNRKLIILNETFQKDGSDEQITGLTVMVDGTIKQAFDVIAHIRDYEKPEEVMRDIIFEGIEAIIAKHRNASSGPGDSNNR